MAARLEPRQEPAELQELQVRVVRLSELALAKAEDKASRQAALGTLGAALMTRFTELKWAARDATPGSRIVNFSRNGESRFAALFGDGKG